MLRMSRARSLEPEESARVCRAVRRLKEQFGSQALLAEELIMPDGTAVSQGAVSQALRDLPVGVGFARAVAMKLGVPFEELISGTIAPPDGTRRHRDLP